MQVVTNGGSEDLAGQVRVEATYLSTRARINRLVERFLSIDVLSDRLSDLPSQFSSPHQRPWEPIAWKRVNAAQIIGVDPHLFVQIISSSAEIEAPIRGYAQESWDYLHSFHPQMALFVGGKLSEETGHHSVGIWEKEVSFTSSLRGKRLCQSRIRLQAISTLKIQPKRSINTCAHGFRQNGVRSPFTCG
jgi:hypothetical protein